MPLPPHLTLIPLFDELRGERVVVRPYRMEDAPALFEAIDESREHLRTFLPWERFHQTVDDTRDFIARSQARWLLRQGLNLSIWEATSGRFLGGTGFHMHEVERWETGYFEIGYWLRASAEGHGYMAEAVRLLTDYAFTSLGANRVEIRCDARNTRSSNVAQRLGFIQEASLRNTRLMPSGELHDTLIFALIPSDPRPTP
jgi:RimJ/RimL family protein N-acetyltransferase